MKETITEIINIKTLKTITIATFVCGMIAHAYVFLNAMFIVDSSSLFWETDFNVILKPDRITPFSGLWSALLGDTKITWIYGLIELSIYSISTYFVCELLEIRSKKIQIVISGILIVNPALIAANVYSVSIEFSMALLFGVVGAYFISKHDFRYNLLGVALVVLCMGTYGPYVSWSICLVVLVGIKRILTDEEIYKIVVYEIKSALFYICALVILLVFCSLLKGEKQERVESAISIVQKGSFLQAFFDQIKNTVLNFIPDKIVDLIGATRNFNSEYSGFFINNTFLVLVFYISLICSIYIFFCILKKDITKEIILFIHLIVLIIAMDLYGIVAQSHTLMQFAYVAPWILFLMSIEIVYSSMNRLAYRIYRIIVGTLAVITIISGVLLSNNVYMKEENTYIAALMLTNRIADKVESVDGYTPGQTEVWFIGDVTKYYANEPIGFYIAKDMMGVRSTFFDCSIYEPTSLEAYLIQHAKLNIKINPTPCFMNYDNPEVYCDIFNRKGHDVTVDEFVDAYNNAGTFPKNNCTFWCDGVLIFKMGASNN